MYGEEIVGLLDTPPVPAAVLVPIVMHAEPSLLLTKRTSHLKKHAGQVSFPGGRDRSRGRDAEAAALREAHEEIALDPASVEIVGRMDDYVTGTGYIITPVLGLIPPGLRIWPSPDEVEAVFEFPFSVLLDPEAPRRQKQHVRGQWREYWVWPHPESFHLGRDRGDHAPPGREVAVRFAEIAMLALPFVVFVAWRLLAPAGSAARAGVRRVRHRGGHGGAAVGALVRGSRTAEAPATSGTTATTAGLLPENGAGIVPPRERAGTAGPDARNDRGAGVPRSLRRRSCPSRRWRRCWTCCRRRGWSAARCAIRCPGGTLVDIDLASPLPPETVMRRLAAAGMKVVPTGLAHGTVTAVWPGEPVEITTLRRDVETDGRHAVVAFTDDWREDAARRDFTINAMSMARDGAVFDYFGGMDDLRAGRLRFVGDPAERVAEDYLRVLRFFRFFARYGAIATGRRDAGGVARRGASAGDAVGGAGVA